MEETIRIPIEEFSTHMRSVLERVLRDKETVVIDAGESGVLTLTPGEPDEILDLPSGKTREDYRAFLDSFGSWEDVDTDKLLEDIRASREISRPLIDL